MTPDFVSPCGRVELYNADCLDVLPTLGKVDAVVTDPPYGIAHPVDYAARGRGKLAGCRDYGVPVWNNPHSNNYPTIAGDCEPFDPSPLLALDVPTCLWVGNYFADRLPPSSGWLVWDKERPDELDQATCEVAWTNFVKGIRRLRHLWNGMMRASEHGQNFHPMQKPVALYQWIFDLDWTPAGTVLDPYMGSGPCGIAAIQSGRNYIGCELSPEYFAIARDRIAEALGQEVTRNGITQRRMFTEAT